MDEFYNSYYIKINDKKCIVDGWSNGPHPDKDITDSILINDKGGYQFRLFPNGDENPPLFDMNGIPLYKWKNNEVVPRSDIEIETDKISIPDPPPSDMDKLEAQVTYTAMLTDTLLEV